MIAHVVSVTCTSHLPVLFLLLYFTFFLILSLLQVTTHSHLLSSIEMEELRNKLNFSSEQVKWFLLQEFDTEMDFSNKIK